MVMEEWLAIVTAQVVVFIDWIALLIVLFGTMEAAVNTVRGLIPSGTGYERREIWLRYARALVAGLTFQLAADIVESSITSSWTAIARLAAIAVIRTFLNYFLERDLADVRERQRSAVPVQAPRQEAK
jgi:uncharacterized membrane protein